MQQLWLQQYPADVPPQVKTDTHPSLVTVLEESFRRHRTLPACI